MKGSMRLLACSAVITLVSFAPLARAQSSPSVVKPVGPISAVPMPEGSSTAILAIDLLTVGALIFVFRRRAARTKR
jgi:hypothetical protein